MTARRWLLLGVCALGIGAGDTVRAQSTTLRVGAEGVSARASAAAVAGQRFAAPEGASTEVMLPDGTVVVIGAGGVVAVARYAWTGQTGAGVLSLGPGTYRVSAGALGRLGALTLLAGSTQVALQGATAVVSVAPDLTVTVYMTVGDRVTVSAQGRCPARLSRPGFATQAAPGGCPSRATRVSAERLSADRRSLRPARRVIAARSGPDTDAERTRAASGPEAGPPPLRPLPRRDGAEVAVNEPRTRVAPPPPPPPPPPIELALALAPGIAVPGATGANLTGSNATSTDGRFFIGNVTGSTSLPEDFPEIDRTDGGAQITTLLPGDFSTSVSFSNTDRQPVDGLALSSGDLETTDLFGRGFDFRTISSDVTVAEARANQGDIYFELLDQGFDLEDTDLFPDPDVVIGSQTDVTFIPFPGGARGLFRNAGYPYADGQYTSIGSIPFDVDARPEDFFTLFHFTETLDGRPDPDGQSSIFAAGYVTDVAEPVPTFRVETFSTSFGLFDRLDDGAVPWQGYETARALLPDVSRAPSGPDSRIPLSDQPVLFVYPGQVANGLADPTAKVVHADLGFLGAGGAQRSTLSISLGSVEKVGEEFDFFRDYRLDLHALGSVRNSPAGVGSVLVSSPLRTSISGGDNRLQIDRSGRRIEGLAGYYLMRSLERSEFSDGAFSRISQSRFRPVNPNEPTQTFQTVRLLEATGSLVRTSDAPGADFVASGTFTAPTAGAPIPGFAPADRDVPVDWRGFAAGLAEVQTADDSLEIAPRASVSGAPNLTLSTDPAANSVAASILLPDAGGAIRVIRLGDTDTPQAARSAYVDRLRFAARSEISGGGLGFAMASFALVSGDPVVDDSGQTSRPVTGLGPDGGTQVPDYRHMAWGVFLGDRIADAGTSLREHMHVGSWVAGDEVDVSDYRDFTGTADYRGHVFGNAFDGASVYTAIGTISKTWDFGTDADVPIGDRASGSVRMDFDGTSYAGRTRLRAGGGFESTDLSAPNRTGGLSGTFFGGVSTAGGVTAPNAAGGQFDITSTPGADAYRATGTFAAERQ